MARKSETISTKWIEGAKRECVKCGAPIKNLDRDVGEVRTRYPGRVREIVCMECHMLPYYRRREERESEV